jgi:aconitate hydratase
MRFGATIRSAFCGPCFGAGDVPSNNGFSIRHTTRNFPSREGSKPTSGQLAYVALMDARSIMATALSGGVLTPATDYPVMEKDRGYQFDGKVYQNTVYQGFEKPEGNSELKFGPGIADWPSILPLSENLLLSVASVIHDPVTTTDELIPSGETSSYRSNPMKIAEFTLSRRDPGYVGRAKEAKRLEQQRKKVLDGEEPSEDLTFYFKQILGDTSKKLITDTGLGSVIFARKPGDGSAREHAASCQRVLGGCANIAGEYATKRYRSNVINWGMLPFITPDVENINLQVGDKLFIPGIRDILQNGTESLKAYVINTSGEKREITLKLPGFTSEDRAIILAGCLINYYRS